MDNGSTAGMVDIVDVALSFEFMHGEGQVSFLSANYGLLMSRLRQRQL